MSQEGRNIFVPRPKREKTTKSDSGSGLPPHIGYHPFTRAALTCMLGLIYTPHIVGYTNIFGYALLYGIPSSSHESLLQQTILDFEARHFPFINPLLYTNLKNFRIQIPYFDQTSDNKEIMIIFAGSYSIGDIMYRGNAKNGVQ